MSDNLGQCVMGELPCQKLIEHHPEAVDVVCVGQRSLALSNSQAGELGRRVKNRAAILTTPRIDVLRLKTAAKIRDFDQITLDKSVLRFDVAVGDTETMQMAYTVQNLAEKFK